MDATRLTMTLLLACFVAALVLFLVGVSVSRGHEAPTGWSYPYACCSGLDCREVGDAYTPNASIRVL